MGLITKIYLSGCCKGNPGHGAWGATIVWPDGHTSVHDGTRIKTTNNQIEVVGLARALRLAGTGATVVVITENKNLVGWMKGTYKRVSETAKTLCPLIDTQIKDMDHAVQFLYEPRADNPQLQKTHVRAQQVAAERELNRQAVAADPRRESIQVQDKSDESDLPF